ncbi:hypothetical protein LCGC14_0569550 [marine sediment metagenome]|uniref:Uncharacterized protein n=1 Tax=marine sediment metagenome TaxID=412755 RepID=A0A0F9U601_9ZZZZ
MKTITVSYGKTVSTGHFESAKFNASISVEVDDDANNQETLDDLMQQVNDFVETEVEGIRSNL